MPGPSRRERGLAKFNEVYASALPAPPEGALDFFDLMLEQLFAEVWTRPALSQRERRLLTMGIIAAQGEPDTFAIQAKAALDNEELTPEQLRELVIHIAAYAGYPRAASLLPRVEQTIAQHQKE